MKMDEKPDEWIQAGRDFVRETIAKYPQKEACDVMIKRIDEARAISETWEFTAWFYGVIAEMLMEDLPEPPRWIPRIVK